MVAFSSFGLIVLSAAVSTVAALMDTCQLGNSNLMVSKICLGTMTWGQQNTPAEGIAQLDFAFKERGINFLDTAEMYPIPTKAESQGDTDRIINTWLKTMKREDVILTTKVILLLRAALCYTLLLSAALC
jgi:aryl-alcohol dehydrogenase-like predicted oxidoreductase